MKKILILWSMALCLLVLQTSTGAAQLPSIPKTTKATKDYFKLVTPAPDISKIPFIQTMGSTGATFHYMGTRSELHGFLIVKGGRIQMFYVTPDNQSIVMGAMFTDDGAMVTSSQVSALVKRDMKVASVIEGAATQNIDVIRAGVQEGGIASLPSDPQAVEAQKEEKLRIPLLLASPGERLIMDLHASSGVLLGNESAPELLMVVSPNCYHCKKTWDGLSEAVKEGKLQIRLIPIARNPKSDEMRIAAQLLRSKMPLKDWEGYLAGDKSALAGEPDKEAYRAIIANRVMTDRWNIMGTPYLVYRSKDKNIKIVQGKPERMAAVLLDLTR